MKFNYKHAAYFIGTTTAATVGGLWFTGAAFTLGNIMSAAALSTLGLAVVKKGFHVCKEMYDDRFGADYNPDDSDVEDLESDEDSVSYNDFEYDEVENLKKDHKKIMTLDNYGGDHNNLPSWTLARKESLTKDAPLPLSVFEYMISNMALKNMKIMEPQTRRTQANSIDVGGHMLRKNIRQK